MRSKGNNIRRSAYPHAAKDMVRRDIVLEEYIHSTICTKSWRYACYTEYMAVVKSVAPVLLCVTGLVVGVAGGYFSNIATIKNVVTTTTHIDSSRNHPLDNTTQSLISSVEIYAVHSENKTVEVRAMNPYNPNTFLSLILTYDEKTRVVSNDQSPVDVSQLSKAKGSVIFKRQGGTLYATLIQAN